MDHDTPAPRWSKPNECLDPDARAALYIEPFINLLQRSRPFFKQHVAIRWADACLATPDVLPMDPNVFNRYLIRQASKPKSSTNRKINESALNQVERYAIRAIHSFHAVYDIRRRSRHACPEYSKAKAMLTKWRTVVKVYEISKGACPAARDPSLLRPELTRAARHKFRGPQSQ